MTVRSNARVPMTRIACLTMLALVACDPGDVDDPAWDAEVHSEDEDPNEEPAVHGRYDDDVLVYRSTMVLDADGNVLESRTEGEMTPEASQAIARPWTAMDGPLLYTTESTELIEDGRRTRSYEVYARPNETPVGEVRSGQGPASLDETTAAYLSEEREEYVLVFRLADFPTFALPLRPADSTLPPTARLEAENRRADALARREAQFEDATREVLAQATDLGATVVSSFPRPGWIALSIPADGVDTLLDSPYFDRVMPGDSRAESPGWALGRGRIKERLNAASFLQNDYTGEQPNPTRHSAGDILIGDIEVERYEDEACAFMDVANCSTSRIRSRYRCDDPTPGGNYCDWTSNFADNDDNAVHGTAVMSVAAGDYTDGQGNGHQLGDPNWTSGAHGDAWERHATGMAPEAGMVLAGQVGGPCTTCGYANAFERHVDYGTDIVLTEFVFSAGQCDSEATLLYEETLEDAYDDGVFVVSPAGNVGGPQESSCNLLSPADTVKAFAVNSFDAAPENCTSHPSTRCLVDQTFSARGGVGVNSQGAWRSGALRGIDSVAPNNITKVTYPGGAYGESGGGFVGTSAAGPHVAGLAALVKDWYVDRGNTWVNNPGQLFTIMLSMTDRHFSYDPEDTSEWTVQRLTGGSILYGLGRSKLRLIDTGGQANTAGNSFKNLWWSSLNTPYIYNPFTSLPAGTQQVKCVAMQHEDMSHKDDVSHIELRLRLKSSCNGATTLTRSDTSFDVKKLVTATADSSTLSGRCVEVEVDPDAVTSQGVAVSIMCTHSSIADDE